MSPSTGLTMWTRTSASSKVSVAELRKLNETDCNFKAMIAAQSINDRSVVNHNDEIQVGNGNSLTTIKIQI